MSKLKEIYDLAEESLQGIRDTLHRKQLTPEEKIEFFESFKEDIIEMIDVKIEKVKTLR